MNKEESRAKFIEVLNDFNMSKANKLQLADLFADVVQTAIDGANPDMNDYVTKTEHEAYVAEKITPVIDAAKAEFKTEINSAKNELKAACDANNAKVEEAFKQADATVTSEFKQADAQIIQDYIAADAVVAEKAENDNVSLRGELTVAYQAADEQVKAYANNQDDAVKAAFAAADTALHSTITNEQTDAITAAKNELTETIHTEKINAINQATEAAKSLDADITKAYIAADTALHNEVNADCNTRVTSLKTEITNVITTTAGDIKAAYIEADETLKNEILAQIPNDTNYVSTSTFNNAVASMVTVSYVNDAINTAKTELLNSDDTMRQQLATLIDQKITAAVEPFATKSEIANMATKSDLDSYVTKDYVSSLTIPTGVMPAISLTDANGNDKDALTLVKEVIASLSNIGLSNGYSE